MHPLVRYLRKNYMGNTIFVLTTANWAGSAFPGTSPVITGEFFDGFDSIVGINPSGPLGPIYIPVEQIVAIF